MVKPNGTALSVTSKIKSIKFITLAFLNGPGTQPLHLSLSFQYQPPNSQAVQILYESPVTTLHVGDWGKQREGQS